MLSRLPCAIVLVALLGPACGSPTAVGIDAPGADGGRAADAGDLRDAEVGLPDAVGAPDSGRTGSDADLAVDVLGEPDLGGTSRDAEPGVDQAAILDVGPDASAPCPIDFAATVEARLRFSADDDRRLLVNEAMIDDLQPARTWGSAGDVTAPLYRHPARPNVIAVEVRNYQRQGGVDRGLLFQVTTSSATLVSDARWRVSTSSSAGWTTAAFDDSAWTVAAEQVQHPGSPYGALLGSSAAWWIWLYDSAIEANKPVTENMWVRRVFYVLVDGTFSDTPGSCP